MKPLVAIALCFATSAIAADRVQGYTRQDGTYVAPHYRSSPNNTRIDNYSSQGNSNPFTGQQGRVDPYTPPAPRVAPQPTYTPPNPYQQQPRNPYR